MPNWCDGTLKVRGKEENIKRFLVEKLQPVAYWMQEPKEKGVTEDEFEFTISSVSGFYIDGTRRHFIEQKDIYFYLDDEQEVRFLALEEFRAAWGLDVEGLTALSKEYGIDFKIYAFEKGMEYNHDFEVRNGEVITNKEIKFDDYEWECIMPNLGG